ncbi:hypothetical protein B296_00047320 [Ensete ventricosum]|uniref:Uncharacterized protein n=1 Tax=Ensete ventricosum TaxID=4639 RepID=A0A426WYC4_ENSVE|nr:hypothetical protein B296_00047320 [Ensete ventricosum]
MVSKTNGGFEAHAPYLRDAFDRLTKVIQLVEVKLGSRYPSTGQEDAEAGTLKEMPLCCHSSCQEQVLVKCDPIVGEYARCDQDTLAWGKRMQRRVLLKNMPLCCHSSCQEQVLVKAAGELDYFSAYIRLREPDKSEDKAEESIGRKRAQGGGECKGKLQVPRQGRRAEAKELHKTNVDGLLIKTVESEGLWVDAGVLDQGTK